MECLFFSVVSGLFFWFLWRQSAAASNRRLTRELGEPLARRFHGQFFPGWTNEQVRFPHGSLTITYRRRYARHPFRGAYDELRVPWPDRSINFELIYDSYHLPNSAEAVWLASHLEPPSSRVADDDGGFCRTWRLAQFQPATTSLLLSPAVRSQLESLRRLGNSTGVVSLTIQHGSIIIRKSSPIAKVDIIDHFIRTSLSVYDQLRLNLTKGIEFLDAELLTPLTEVKCQICGGQIHSGLVYCRRCQTPHHQDCWIYNGVCSIYGCGETQYITPPVAPIKPSELK